jgi:hypothetical protein
MSISGAISDFGGAAGDLLASEGSFASADAYGAASDIATKNAALTERSGQIQQQQEDIQITKALGGEVASTAGAGFGAGGTAGDLMRSSVQQGALAKQLLANQTEITAQGYEQQASAFTGQQKAAVAQGQAQQAQGAANAASGIFSLVGWIICTELVKQGRLPAKFWAVGTKVFAGYPDAVREGYYVWAVPSVRHLRAHPYSLYSCFLCAIFNWRAENIAARAGIKRARKLIRGALVTAFLWPLCYGLGWVRLKLKKNTDWKGLYNGAR